MDLKQSQIIGVVIIRKRIVKMNKFIVLFLASSLLMSCEQFQKVSRKSLTIYGGDFKVTYVDDSFTRTWIIKKGKVTSEPKKGYYFFWATVNGKKKYIHHDIAGPCFVKGFATGFGVRTLIDFVKNN